MEHTDYAGLATLIAALAAAVVSILGAVQSLRNSQKIDQVRHAVNGQSDKRAAEAFVSGVKTGTMVQAKKEENGNV